MKKPLWQKILIGADVGCAVGAIICLTVSLCMGYPENWTAVLFQGGYLSLLGRHFVFHGILNWKEHRWLAIFELGAVTLGLIFVMLAFLR